MDWFSNRLHAVIFVWKVSTVYLKVNCISNMSPLTMQNSNFPLQSYVPLHVADLCITSSSSLSRRSCDGGPRAQQIMWSLHCSTLRVLWQQCCHVHNCTRRQNVLEIFFRKKERSTQGTMLHSYFHQALISYVLSMAASMLVSIAINAHVKDYQWIAGLSKNWNKNYRIARYLYKSQN
jgi:hypothetical protein